MAVLRFDPSASYLMPAHFGDSPLSSYCYADVTTVGVTAEVAVDWQLLTWEQNPTQAHIIEALGKLPIEAYGPCVVTEGSQVIRVENARELAW